MIDFEVFGECGLLKVDIFNTENKYQIIYADPPWRNPKSGTKARNNEKHYPSMATDEICRLPITNISERNAILFLWICFPCLEDSLKVINSWGFEYYGLGFDWCKIKSDGTPKIGCGYYTRQNNELCLVGVKHGMENRIKPLVKNIGCSILEQPREHSRKPDIVRENIIKICGDIPRIELFARQEYDGWDCWGNGIKKKKVMWFKCSLDVSALEVAEIVMPYTEMTGRYFSWIWV